MRVMRTSDKVHSFKPWNCEQITLMLNLCSIRYANVKPVNAPPMRQWLQATVKNPPIAVETPSASDLGVQTGVYGALMALTYVNGTSSSSVPYGGVDVPGLILAGSFGASLYFMTKKNIKLGKATIITVGGLAAGAVVGSVVENWLQAYQLGSERRCSLVWSEELVTF